ncbi:type II toxin-antitoxin system CcdA family antitoxin [Rhizobium sp. TH2]|uniref:type II toxin-antitoxin system CcdA family antitoxin n=1 Tax=Rhizobium sp. TH2 TaxID=2775403 RepID=UPI0021589424|nr:type II toxin-antitoxin system CcdA family antitoxin [Rhizobium sp. TH2]UVC10612.1 type II toxin-antitoxin system CcdA family antitoxin [Rhizobium sp. TH2]
MTSSKKVPENMQADLERLRMERAARTPQERLEAERLFKRENAKAFASMNAWVEEHGLPLEKYRQF